MIIQHSYMLIDYFYDLLVVWVFEALLIICHWFYVIVQKQSFSFSFKHHSPFPYIHDEILLLHRHCCHHNVKLETSNVRVRLLLMTSIAFVRGVALRGMLRDSSLGKRDTSWCGDGARTSQTRDGWFGRRGNCQGPDFQWMVGTICPLSTALLDAKIPTKNMHWMCFLSILS